MAMKRTGEPWMKADAFGRSIPCGIGLNLLTRDPAALAAFCRDVLLARLVYQDADFAVAEIAGSQMLIHADHTYSGHPMSGVIAGVDMRGIGAELRVYGLDPDGAEVRARAAGHLVLAGSSDKPHGLRECHLIAPEGYVFVPCVAIGANETRS